MSKLSYILFLFVLWTGTLPAQTPKFTASVDKSEIGTNDRFEVTFSINASGDRFTPPTLAGFVVVGGPNQSSSMEMVNGHTTVSYAISYVLTAQKEGDYVIGPASIFVDGKKLNTDPIKIKVVKGHTVQNAPDASVADGSLAKQLFLRIVLDKDNVYQGQQLTLTYRIYTSIDIAQSNVVKLPDLTGFWNEDVSNPKKIALWKPETINGVKYNYADIKQIILFPEHSGSINIDPFSVDFIVRVPNRSRDFMDQFFGGGFQSKKYSAKSDPVTVHVKPLPDAGKPASFTGAVGNFSIHSSVDKQALKANESFNYKVDITGNGNFKLLKNPGADFPSDFEKYDPKITDSVKDLVTGVTGTRYYNYLLIPRNGGNYNIEPFKFSYFNPSTGKYVSLETKPFPIKVAKGISQSNVTSLAGDKQDVKLLAKDIRYIKTGDAGLEKVGEPFFGSPGYYLLLLLGPVACIGALGFRNYQRKSNSDIVKVRSRRAGKLAAKHLANAQKQLTANNKQAFYEAVFRGLYGYLGDKLNIAYGDLNKDIIVTTLAERGIGQELTDRLADTIDMCDMARYAPVTISDQEMYDKAKGVISDIENES